MSSTVATTSTALATLSRATGCQPQKLPPTTIKTDKSTTASSEKLSLRQRIRNALSLSPQRERANRDHHHHQSFPAPPVRRTPSKGAIAKASSKPPSKSPSKPSSTMRQNAPKSVNSLQNNADQQIELELQREESILEHAQQETRAWQDALSQLSLTSTKSWLDDDELERELEEDDEDADDISEEYHRQVSSSSSLSDRQKKERQDKEKQRELQRQQRRRERDRAAERAINEAIRQAEVDLAQSSSSLHVPNGNYTRTSSSDDVDEAQVQAILKQAMRDEKRTAPSTKRKTTTTRTTKKPR